MRNHLMYVFIVVAPDPVSTGLLLELHHVRERIRIVNNLDRYKSWLLRLAGALIFTRLFTFWLFS